jgi:xanthine dehydrogenase YagS FAD-binding subunit
VKAFAYVDARNEKEAVAALKFVGGVAVPLAGGQDLLARMKDYVASPDRLVNVKGALETTVVAMPDGGLKIGAAMKIVDLMENAAVQRLYPAVIAASGEIGTPQIRNQGTVGGNINQRPRCWYFRNEEFVCYKKGGNRCFSPAGENQFHAIFGNNGPSHIVHPSSLAVPFVAYGARFRLASSSGEREVPASEYFTMPTLRNVQKENVLGDDELLTHVILPPPGNVKSGHYEVRYKASHDWPLAFTTVVLAMNGNTIQSARVVLGAVAPVPWRSEDAERALAGKPLNEQTATEAADAAIRAAQPLNRNGYKVQIARTAVRRAILQAAGRPVERI